MTQKMSFSALRRTVLLAAISGFGFMAAAPAAQAVSLDVPYVPTPSDVVKRMLEVAEVGPEDFVIDLGSGDGRIAIAAVKEFNAMGSMGVDLNPERIAEATANAKEAGVTGKVEFREQNLFDTDFSKATVLTMYLLPNVNVSLRPKILKLKPGTRVVSHAFDMDEWEADHYERVDGRSVYMWIVPAAVEGRWKVEAADGDLELSLIQEYQNVTGTAKGPKGESLPVAGKVRGSNIELNVGEGDGARKLRGNVQGSTMLVSEGGSNENWKGSRL